MPFRCFVLESPSGFVDLVLVPAGAEEMARELFPGARPRRPARVLYVRAVRVLAAGGLVLSVPFSSLARQETGGNYAMSYVYFGTSGQQTENVLRAAGTLDVVSPSYFDINPDGSLKLNAVSTRFISAMHEKSIRVVPFLSNHWDRPSGQKALENAEALSTQIAQAVEKYGLDGVNVDIENVTEAHRSHYVELVRLLRAKLPAHKEVSVAVAANPSGWDKGWHGSYDYAGLAQHADHLFLMTYDEHYSGSAPGSVAGYPFVERSVEYALRHVPGEKLVLGIPFFGRMWSSDGTVSGQGVSLTQVQQLHQRFGGQISYDAAQRAPVLRTTLTEPVTVAGRRLPAGSYEIHYENADSIKSKLALVGRYGLKGAGNWSAGQETADVWDYYELWLNGTYFSDISGHFAKDHIVKLSSQGILKGVSDARFGPELQLTRAQAAVIAVRTLGLAAAEENAGFSDTASHWARAEIAAAAQAGLVTGYPDGTFRPDAPVSRAETAVLLARLVEASLDPQAPSPFPDVPQDHWAAHEIAALARAGIITGYTDGSFRPETNVTRGESAALFSRAQPEIRP